MEPNSRAVLCVIIPVYKDLHGLTDTLNSLKNQSVSFDQFEVIIANDGANEAISAYCKDANLTCIDISPNKGSYNARNQAISKAGDHIKYLAFIDADIIAHTNWVKNGLYHLQEYDYVAGDVQIRKELVTNIATYHDYLTAFPIQKYFNELGFGVTGNLFIRRTVIDNIGAFNPVLRSGGDMEFGIRAGENNSIKKTFAADCVVYHAPRTHVEKVDKLKRVMQGQKDLLTMDSEKFKFLERNETGLKLLLPPRWAAVENIYQYDKRFSKWDLYLYVYKLRLAKFLAN
ncbi:glycosyltransferase family 2 protein [Inquilinus sp. KBS0705]|nr:glycosyltransferase family 2 protein [Inquilinus sp. KBS0705]